MSHGRSGHTLLEIAIALAIVSVVAGLAVASGRRMISRYNLMKAARTLHADIQSLKAEAIASNREMRLVFVAADAAMDPTEPQVGAWRLQAGNRSQGSTRWDTLPIDEGGDIDDSDGDRDLADGGRNQAGGISLSPWPTLEGPGPSGTNVDAIVFSPRGFVANPPTDFVDGYIELELVNKRSLDEGGDERVQIKLTRGGLTRMETGESSTLPANPVGAGEATTQ